MTLDVLIAMFVGVVAYALIWLLTTDTLHDGWLKWIHDQATSQLERLADGDRTKFFRIRNIPMFGIPTLICYSFVARPLRFGLAVAALIITAGLPVWEKNSQIVHRERSFFGVLQVEHVASKDLFKLMHGTTLHGEQIRQPEYQHQPLSYYHVTGPVGDVFRAMQGRGGPKDLALIGLGSGSLAAYGREGQRFTFYDIDPAVARIAKNPEYFTYLSDCKADYRIVLGDARLRIEGAEDHEYDLIVVDAFSSDSIPIHLITYEAVELYFKKLKKDGIVLMHISNRHLDLEPVLGNIAKAMGVGGLRRHDPFDNKMGKSTSDWVALAKDENGLKGLVRQNSWEMEANGLLGAGTLPFGGMLGPLSFTSTLNIDLSGGWVQNKNGDWEDDRYHLRHRLTGGWNEVATDKKVGVWNNDYSNLLSVFLWR